MLKILEKVLGTWGSNDYVQDTQEKASPRRRQVRFRADFGVVIGSPISSTFNLLLLSLTEGVGDFAPPHVSHSFSDRGADYPATYLRLGERRVFCTQGCFEPLDAFLKQTNSSLIRFSTMVLISWALSLSTKIVGHL